MDVNLYEKTTGWVSDRTFAHCTHVMLSLRENKGDVACSADKPHFGTANRANAAPRVIAFRKGKHDDLLLVHGAKPCDAAITKIKIVSLIHMRDADFSPHTHTKLGTSIVTHLLG